MKAILEFNLDDPTEEERFHLCAHAASIYLALRDIDISLRNKVKYENNKEAELVREEINHVLTEYNLHLEMLR